MALHEKLIAAALHFANEPVESTAQVEQLFQPFAFDGQWESISPTFLDPEALGRLLENGGFDTAEEAETHGISQYQGNRDTLRMRLEQIVHNPKKAAADMERWLDEMLEDKGRARLGFLDSRLRIKWGIHGGVEATYALALALLFETDYARRLRRCPQCTRFFVIWHPRRVKQRYCSPACSTAVQSEKNVRRVQEWRKRQRRK